MDQKLRELIHKSVHEVLDKYLAGELLRGIENEILHAVEWGIVNNGGDSNEE